jgi:hypothetical protein
MQATSLFTPSPSAAETSLFGATIPTTISGITPHTWVADSKGLYHTATDLAAEWQGLYDQMLHGQGGALSAIQRLEGNAEAVFENTGLAKLSATQQAVDREDVQREFDAMAGAMTIDQSTYHIDPKAAFTETSYLRLEQTLQGNPILQELGIQGHGLNNPPSARYEGYTNDFQNNVDNKTLYVGGGLNNDQRAIPDFFDDNLLSHTPFPTVFHDGKLEQLNQNGTAENTLKQAIDALNRSAYTQVYVSGDFVHPGGPKHGPVVAVDPAHPPKDDVVIARPSVSADGKTETTLFGFTVPTTLTDTAHSWVAGSDGLYHTSTDLGAEWKAIYDKMLAGDAAGLTPLQRMEGNAEAVFLNTGLDKLSAAQQEADREDTQRELDAIWAAMKIDAKTLGILDTAPFTKTSYIAMEHTLQSHPDLEELAIQGHGLNHPPSKRYDGYTQDFQNNVDNKTKYVGGGLNSGDKAIADFFDDNIISHAPFPTVFRNGRLVQLNQNGDAENTLKQAITALNETMFYRTYTSSDFKA